MAEPIDLTGDWADNLEGRPFKRARVNGACYDVASFKAKDTNEAVAVMPTNIE